MGGRLVALRVVICDSVSVNAAITVSANDYSPLTSWQVKGATLKVEHTSLVESHGMISKERYVPSRGARPSDTTALAVFLDRAGGR